MTLQIKGVVWSIGIHGIVILAFFLLQYFTVVKNKTMIIDFTFAGVHESSAMDQSSLHQKTSVRQPPDEALPQKAITRQQSVPRSQPHKAALAELSRADHVAQAFENTNRETAVQTLLPVSASGSGDRPAVDGSDRTAAADSSRSGADTSRAVQSSPGRPDSIEQSRAVYLKEHFVYIRDKITGSILYPEIARKMGWRGQVRIAFVVCEDGGVRDVRVIDGSGFSMLDRNAIDTVKNVAPFPKPPVRAEIRMAVTYRLN
ncbi:MAG: hypothetical protein CVU71_17100 [Deltaproteobacteria bacterium HGW-Deltaproteobacteria-6]|jgi:protein TonB|nr:MAG: hypothetical protein CVU71_17100 [Deltaproteobacteria bacterium HGW-Deltaproteobacteria-6]